VSTATQGLGLLSAQEAAAQLGVDPSTIRQWVRRGHLAPLTKTRSGSRVTAWYRAQDVWACARQRLTRQHLAAIRATWAEVDRILAERAGQVSL
jgi:excisionase family DNA binding protein